MSDLSLANIIVTWAEKNWPDLITTVGTDAKNTPLPDVVHIRLDWKWTILSIVGPKIEHRTRAVDQRGDQDPYEDGWKFESLNPGDPEYFDKLNSIVESSKTYTELSARRMK